MPNLTKGELLRCGKHETRWNKNHLVCTIFSLRHDYVTKNLQNYFFLIFYMCILYFDTIATTVSAYTLKSKQIIICVPNKRLCAKFNSSDQELGETSQSCFAVKGALQSKPLRIHFSASFPLHLTQKKLF